MHKPKFAKEYNFLSHFKELTNYFCIFGHNHQNKFDKMKTFGKYLRTIREEKELPLRKIAATLDIDTSLLSKIERNKRRATIDMIPIMAETLEKSGK